MTENNTQTVEQEVIDFTEADEMAIYELRAEIIKDLKRTLTQAQFDALTVDGFIEIAAAQQDAYSIRYTEKLTKSLDAGKTMQLDKISTDLKRKQSKPEKMRKQRITKKMEGEMMLAEIGVLKNIVAVLLKQRNGIELNEAETELMASITPQADS